MGTVAAHEGLAQKPLYAEVLRGARDGLRPGSQAGGRARGNWLSAFLSWLHWGQGTRGSQLPRWHAARAWARGTLAAVPVADCCPAACAAESIQARSHHGSHFDNMSVF